MTREAPQSRLILPVVSPYQGYQGAGNVDKYPIDQGHVVTWFRGVVHTAVRLNQFSEHLKAIAKIDCAEMRNTPAPQARRHQESSPTRGCGWSD